MRMPELGIDPDFTSKIFRPLRTDKVREGDLQRNANSLERIERAIDRCETAIPELGLNAILSEHLLRFDSKRSCHSHAAGSKGESSAMPQFPRDAEILCDRGQNSVESHQG